MDYRSYENKVNETKNDLVGFLSLKNAKIHDYSTSIVDAYLDLLNNGDISIKSFKLKIIHNDHANEKNTLEFSELLKNNYEEFKEFLDNFFLDYEKNLKSYKYFPTRKSDLLQVNNPLKRKKQENITKINNFEKDLALKIKEVNNQIIERKKSYNQAVNEINRRLSIDLQRNNDSCMKEYLPLERALLDVDEKEKIKELRTKITEIRSKSLDYQNQLKTKSYSHLKEEGLKYIEETGKMSLELELLKQEYEKKILLANKEINLLQLEEANNVFQYDYQKDVQSIDLFSHNLDSYFSIVDSINEKVLNDFDLNKNEFIELKLNKKILECMLRFYRINFYDPAIRMINRISSFYNEVKENFIKIATEMRNDHYMYNESVIDKVKEFDEKVFKVKKTKKSDFENNIRMGLDNLYSTKFIDEQYKNFLNYINGLIAIINEHVTKINCIVEEDSYKLVLSQNNSEEYPFIQENISNVKMRFDNYKNNYLNKRNLEKDEFENKGKKDTHHIESKYELDLETIEKTIKDIKKKSKLHIDKENKRIETEYSKKCKESLSDLKRWKKIL